MDGVAFGFAEKRNQHVGTRDLIAPGGLRVDGGTLHNALEAGSGFRITRLIRREAGKVLVHKFGHVTAQRIDIYSARFQDDGGITIVHQSEEKMFQGRTLVSPFTGERQGVVKRLFEVSRQHAWPRPCSLLR